MSAIINGDSPSVTFSDGTTQSTAFTNGSVTQAKLATGVAGTGPAFSAYANTTQSVTTTTLTKVAINTEEYDTNSNYNTTNYRFTPTVAGYYQVNAILRIGGTGITAAYVAIYKNGAIYQRGTEFNQTLAVTQIGASLLVYLNGTTDYIELYGLIAGSSALTFTYAANYATSYFQASMVRGA